MSASRPQLVVVIGAGPAGLAASHELKRRGIEHRVLERGASVGTSWRGLYDSLVLHTGRHLSHLPGMRFPRGTPLFPPRDALVSYLERYAGGLPVETRCAVHRVTRVNQTWRVLSSRGEIRAGAIVVATGIISNPRVPRLPGSEEFGGPIRHSVEYLRAEACERRRILIVGTGNSANEIATELAAHGARVSVAVRSGANVVPREILGIPIQYLAALVRRLPAPVRRSVVGAVGAVTEWRNGPSPFPRPPYGPLDSIPMIGTGLVRAIREGRIALRGGIERLTGRGARFADGTEEEFDEILLATGFDPAIEILGGLVRLDERRFARRRDRVVSLDQPNLYFIGHNYDSAGALWNIRRDAPLIAERLSR
ncbi:MAG TPA: NAD(P)/FAD-dependent oxidoreductase [Thermoanaerobaculia bacterium]|nr:NAD(P)/FAD-dependent oxidoreductase [Thermoanaerobaculia bacterium]